MPNLFKQALNALLFAIFLGMLTVIVTLSLLPFAEAIRRLTQ